jgi:hypothetical protein
MQNDYFDDEPSQNGKKSENTQKTPGKTNLIRRITITKAITGTTKKIKVR